MRQFRLNLNQGRPLIYKVMNNYVGSVLVCIRCAGLGFSILFLLLVPYMNIHEQRGACLWAGRGEGPRGLHWLGPVVTVAAVAAAVTSVGVSR